MKLPRSAFFPAFGAVALMLGSVNAGALAQSVSVTLNGSPVALNPPPQTRAGRVFVPLRGIFENLGATVVYADGTINAQGNGRDISLHIGSTQATVNGQPQTLDVAPFIVGASTYVPLRFVSQALGASVNYDGTNHIVAISNGSGPVAETITPPPPRVRVSALRLSGLQPARDAQVTSQRPTIEAQFVNAQAEPNSLRISIDGTDVTQQTSRSPVGFVYAPQSPLQSMQHLVRVAGRDTGGNAINQSWRFASGTVVLKNTLVLMTPANGSAVGTEFTVRGRTLPGGRVVVQAGASEKRDSVGGEVGAILGWGGGANVRNEVTANSDGSFSSVVALNAPRHARVRLVVTSTDPRTQTASPPVSRTLTIQ